jgi:hypothetical protein
LRTLAKENAIDISHQETKALLLILLKKGTPQRKLVRKKTTAMRKEA